MPEGVALCCYEEDEGGGPPGRGDMGARAGEPGRAGPLRDRVGTGAAGNRSLEGGFSLAHALHWRSGNMETTRGLYAGMVALGISVILAACAAELGSQQGADPATRIGENDLGGVVTSANGAEAGVWVIAETTELPTKFIKIVVTDDHGRYVLPELPKANFSVWVRGYGLVDSPKVRTTPGKLLDLRAVVAPNAAAAAEYYPAIYWYSMLRVPEKSEFPGTGPQGNGMPVTLKSQAQWLDVVKTNKLFADWTDRIAAGELPASKPTR